MPSGRLILAPGADEQDWLACRRDGIGGSDLAGILNRSPYTTPARVYLDKIGRGRDLIVSKPLENPIFWGRVLEDPIAAAWQDVTGEPVWKTGTYCHRDRPWQRANPDRLGAGFVLEVKTASVSQARHWDPDVVPYGIPFYYLTQVQHYLTVTGLPFAWVICLIGGNKLVIRRVDADDRDQSALTAREERFWEEHVLAERPPLVTPRDNSIMSALYPAEPESKLDLPESVVPFVARHKQAKEQLASVQADIEELEVEIKKALGHNVIGRIEGKPVVTWKPTKRIGADGNAVRPFVNKLPDPGKYETYDPALITTREVPHD